MPRRGRDGDRRPGRHPRHDSGPSVRSWQPPMLGQGLLTPANHGSPGSLRPGPAPGNTGGGEQATASSQRSVPPWWPRRSPRRHRSWPCPPPAVSSSRRVTTLAQGVPCYPHASLDRAVVTPAGSSVAATSRHKRRVAKEAPGPSSGQRRPVAPTQQSAAVGPARRRGVPSGGGKATEAGVGWPRTS